jgi:hypothetical protein
MTTITEMILTPALPISTPVKGVDFDPSIGSGALVMTASGWKATTDVEAYVRAEALRLGTMEPSEPEFA